MSKWKHHKIKWSNCDNCDLCETRKNVVLFKGKIPCDVLFVGEAPGESEDLFGKPFVGPAGKLLDQMIKESGIDRFHLGFTNLICCIPLDEDGNKTNEPGKEHIKACASRLLEMITIARPKSIVAVGSLAKKHLSKYDCSIIHPGAILRADVTQRGLQVQQAVIRLTDLGDDL